MKRVLLVILASILLLVCFTSCDIISGFIGDGPSTGGECEHEWAEATCKAPSTCTKCGRTNGEKGDHRYLDATCEEPKTCQDCGKTVGRFLGHDYSMATCTSPKICKVCGDVKGETEHDFIPATCEEPMICRDCGAIKGEPLGHDMDVVVTEPTCSADGCERTLCSVCGLVESNVVIPMIGHDDLAFEYNGDATAAKDGTATASCPYCDYSITEKLVGSSTMIADSFVGKKISILGDSISTYINITSGAAANTTNSTIRNNIVWYGYQPSQPVFGGTSVDSTWWQMTVNALGATLLVNNSNAGESVYQSVLNRCMQLHDDTGDNAGETPDIIFVYLGTNDNHRTMGNVNSLTMDQIKAKGDDPSFTPTTLAEAYAVMLYRIQKTYPNAEIYCLTNLERSDMDISLTHAVSGVIRDAVARFDGIYLADIGLLSGITRDNPDYETYMPKDQGGKSLHPGAEGMKEIYRVVFDTVLKNSRYMSGEIEDLIPGSGD